MKNRAKLLYMLITLAFLTLTAVPAGAVVVDLYDWAFNVDGTVYSYQTDWNDLSDVTDLDYSAFDGISGLGILTWTTSIAGGHSFLAFFDHEMDQDANTFFNEYGAAVGSAATGQSWEIDEPGWNDPWGDIYGNTLGNTLDSLVFGGVSTDMPNDVSMAMGWDFTLLADQTATISLILSETDPGSGFYLSQTDPETGANFDTPASIYFSSTLTIEDTGNPNPNPVPEPATLLLMGLGLAGLFGVQRKKRGRSIKG